jgi:hypothetical protein
MKRRHFLAGLVAAPFVIVTPGLLMPVKPRLEFARGQVIIRDNGWYHIFVPWDVSENREVIINGKLIERGNAGFLVPIVGRE